jgi:hypothetical protein
VSEIALLVVLLVLAYVGSILVSGRAIRGWGLPSGSEWIVLGFVLGPRALGVFDLDTLKSLEPLVQVGLGWLALVIGVEYGHVGTRRVPVRRMFAGFVFATLSCIGVATVFASFALYFELLRGSDLLIAALGAGAVSCETTRHAVRWVVERYAAAGPLSDLVGDIAEADDIVPLLVITLAFALAPTPSIALPLPVWALGLATLGLGTVLGSLGGALLRIEHRPTETWGIVLGAALLGIGLAERLGQSSLGALFGLGITLALFSGKRAELREMLVKTEHPVLLPVLVLAGAFLDFGGSPLLPWLIVLVLAARVAAKFVSGTLLRLSRAGAGVGPLLGFGLLPSGALTMAFGLAFALRFPSFVGSSVLAIAAVVALFGELVGPTSLHAALKRAGEIDAAGAAE